MYHENCVSNTHSIDILLVLIACCAETKNPAACRVLCTSNIYILQRWLLHKHSSLCSNITNVLRLQMF